MENQTQIEMMDLLSLQLDVLIQINEERRYLEGWLTSVEVMQILNCSSEQLIEYQESGKLRYQEFRNRYLYNKESVDDLLNPPFSFCKLG